VQEPLVSTNASTTVATTGVTGTTDAGTQITITPQISVSEYVTLSYSINQSSFLGAPTTSTDGTPIPPAKSSNTVASVATIPDGYIIALGGLSTRNISTTTSQIPLLGSIPFLGYLFKSQTVSDSDTRFYVFIRANVMRHETFADLRRMSTVRSGQAALADDGWPTPAPRFIK
jgi:general secretion pathway protein D